MKNLYITLIIILVSLGCKEIQETKEQWVHTKTTKLEGINPIGIAQDESGLWLSDGDHNRVVLVNTEGVVLKTIDSLDRPMHITSQEGNVYIPQYGNDEVLSVADIVRKPIKVRDSLDAPAGVAVSGSQIAIADFYNNKIHYSEDGDDWITFGKEGKANGDFYYPTDVQITKDAIWVADAYNNRVQQFDKKGNHIQTIGEDQKINAATGIYVSKEAVFVTDFENNRVLIFDLQGVLKQELKTDILKPTDLLLINDLLYVTNYKGKSLSVYRQEEVVVDNTLHSHGGEEDHHDH